MMLLPWVCITPFGKSRGAGGEHQRHHVVGTGFVLRHLAGTFLEELLPGQVFAVDLHAGQGHDRDALGKTRSHRFPVGALAEEQDLCVRELGDVLRRARRQRREHAHGNVARAHDRKVRHKPVRPVARQEDHVVTVAETRLDRRRTALICSRAADQL
jgi:hypothetical protein